MKDLIKVKSSEIENLEFRITAIDCDDTEFEQVKEAGENAETGEIYEEIYYSRTAWGRVEYTAEYKSEKLSLAFGWQAEASRKESYTDSFDFEVYLANEPDETANFVIVDDDGDIEKMNIEAIKDRAGSFDDLPSAAKALLPAPEYEEVLVETVSLDEEQAEYIVERDDAPNLRFWGQILADATSREPYNDGGRWQELTLYKTVGGKYVCSKVDVSCWVGERTRYKAIVCESISDVIEFFGRSSLAKELYRRKMKY